MKFIHVNIRPGQLGFQSCSHALLEWSGVHISDARELFQMSFVICVSSTRRPGFAQFSCAKSLCGTRYRGAVYVGRQPTSLTQGMHE